MSNTNVFLPTAGRYGVMPVQTYAGNVGAISPVVAGTATTIYRCPTIARAQSVLTASVQCSTAIAVTGTGTARLYKRNATGAVSIALTAAFDLETLAVDVVTAVPLTATTAERCLKVGDYLAWDIAASGAVGTQPVNLFMVVETGLRN